MAVVVPHVCLVCSWAEGRKCSLGRFCSSTRFPAQSALCVCVLIKCKQQGAPNLIGNVCGRKETFTLSGMLRASLRSWEPGHREKCAPDTAKKLIASLPGTTCLHKHESLHSSCSYAFVTGASWS